MPENDSNPSPPPSEKPRARRSFTTFLEWIGRYETSVLVAIVVAIAAVWVFIEIADEVRDGDTLRFDDWALRALREPNDLSIPIGPKWLPKVGRDLTALGGVTFLGLLTMSVVGYFWLRKMYAVGTLILLITLGASLLNVGLKDFYERPRPELVPHLTEEYSASFPSGHAMLSTVVFLTLATLLGRFTPEYRLRAYYLGIALTLSLLVGVSRVYMGVHYPTDVLAGWVAGLVWGLSCWLVTKELQRRGIIEWPKMGEQEEEEKKPADGMPIRR